MKFSILFIVLFFVFKSGFSQKIELILNKTSGHAPLNYAYKPVLDEDTSELKIPNEVKLKYYNRYYTAIAPLEEYFRMYKLGKLDYPAFLTKVKAYTHVTVDTSVLKKSALNFPSSIIHFISGIGQNDNKIILVDANQDNIISKNEIFTFSVDSMQKIKTNIPIASEKLNSIFLRQKGKDGTSRYLEVKIIPLPYFNDYKDVKKKATCFYLLRNECWTGKANICNEPFTFYAESKPFCNEFQLMNFRINGNNVLDKKLLDLKDYWSDKNLSLSVDSITKLNEQQMKIFISYQSPPRKTNDTTFTMSLQKVSNKKFETLHSFLNSKDYILIDYWGTWCVPCIEKLPRLKEIQKEFSNNLDLISIAYDYSIDAVREFDNKNGINWNDYYIDRNNSQSLIKPLEIFSYPTFRLYNKLGKLVFSGQSEADLEKIREIVSKTK